VPSHPLDGWSGAIVLREVLEGYHALVAGREPSLPAVRPLKEYLAWLKACEPDDAPRFWRTHLAGVSSEFHLTRPARRPSRTGSAAPRPNGPHAAVVPGPGEPGLPARGLASVSLSAASVASWSRAHRVTSSSLLLGCWGLLLSRQTGAGKPVCGVTFSGRAAGPDGVEAMVGVFSNTVPLAIPVDREKRVGEWFADVLRLQQEVQRFEHSSLGQILTWTGLSLRRPLFDTLLVHANYPRRTRASLRGMPETAIRHDVQLTDFRGDVTSTHPITLLVKPDDLTIDLLYDRSSLTQSGAERLLSDFAALVEAVLSGTASTIGGLVGNAGGSALPLLRPGPPAHDGPPGDAPQSAADHTETPAASPVEAQLMRIFDDLIDVPQIGRDDNFFELGGDSLLLPRLVDRIQEDFDVALPLGMVVQGPTVKELAALVQSQASPRSWRSLVGVRRGGARDPLYLVHGLGGEIGFCYGVAGALHPEQPLYGLQPPPEPMASLVSLATHYANVIREHQPRGPYYLGGYCLGGCIAFEMARQLSHAGERVALLMIIDSASPDVRPSAPRLAPRLKRLASRTPREIAATVGRHATAAAQRLIVRRDPPPPPADGSPHWYGVPRAFQEIATRHYHAAQAYVPQPYDGDVWLLRTEDDRFDADLGWRRWVRGRLTIDIVPGNHGDVLKEPFVHENARRLAAAVESATAAAG
jgi:thioesterase domain-containing protein/acyl carrier protein